jgi:hypothetical protein
VSPPNGTFLLSSSSELDEVEEKIHQLPAIPFTNWDNVGRLYANGTPIPDLLQHSMCQSPNQTCHLEITYQQFHVHSIDE